VKLKAVKSLGQSFLVHQATADRLVAELELRKDETVIEIGSGKGVLTEKLVSQTGQIIAIEIDPRLANFLRNKFVGAQNLTIINRDFLQISLSDFQNVKIIGNLPFNITTAILEKLLAHTPYWTKAVLTVQREFAQRLLARPGSRSYGILSVLCNYYCPAQRLFNIPARYFKPTPKVTSTAIALEPRAVELLPFSIFFPLVRNAFMPQPRKLLLNNLAANLKLSKKNISKIFIDSGLTINIRPEDLTAEQFAQLTKTLISSGDNY